MTELPENQTPEDPGISVKKEAIPGVQKNGGDSDTTCYAAGLEPPIKNIARSASSVADFLTGSREQTLSQKVWHSIKVAALYISIFVGSLFALEQYLASNHWALRARVEAQLLSASAALGDDDHIVQANAVRSLARISEFRTYTLSGGIASVGQHLRAGIFGYSSDYPYFEDSWLVLRDYATARSVSASSLVSTQILREGSRLELRTRQVGGAPKNWNRGSLLFRAKLEGAQGNDLELRGIQFGAANLKRSNLSGINCSKCGMLGVQLDNATIRGARFDFAYLAESNINKSDFSFSHLNSANFKRASLVETKFLQTDLTEAIFLNADLNGALFSQAILAGTDFRGSKLRGARFEQSDVSEAKFDGADVAGADYTRAIGFSDTLLANAINTDKAIIPKPSEVLK